VIETGILISVKASPCAQSNLSRSRHPTSPIWTAHFSPSTQPNSKAVKVRVSFNGEDTIRPTGVQVVLASMRVHRNKFAVQGSAAHLLFILCSQSNEADFVRICETTAPEETCRTEKVPRHRNRPASASATSRASPGRNERPSSATIGNRRSQSRLVRLSSSSGVHTAPEGYTSKFDSLRADSGRHLSHSTTMSDTMAFSSVPVLEAESPTRMCLRILRRWSKSGNSMQTMDSAWALNLSKAQRKQILSAYHSATLALVTIASRNPKIHAGIRYNETARSLLSDAITYHDQDEALQELGASLDLSLHSEDWDLADRSQLPHSSDQQPSQQPSYMRATKSMKAQNEQAQATLRRSGRTPPVFPKPVHSRSQTDEPFFTTNRLDTAPGPSWYREKKQQQEPAKYMFDRKSQNANRRTPPAGAEIIVKTVPMSLPSTGPISTGLFPPRDPKDRMGGTLKG